MYFAPMDREQEGHKFEAIHTKWCGILIEKEDCPRSALPLVVFSKNVS